MFLRASLHVRRTARQPPHAVSLVRLLSTKTADPLRILFCGSDAFSAASLKALDEVRAASPDLVSSIDVVCRPPKRTGRGLKVLREVPIAETARELRLPVHYVDTFKGWQLPRTPSQSGEPGINLVVAVSFGLLVPRRIIAAARYGGLNVHPSLLPDFRGAAPIHHTLLAARSRTGVTLQTLHPTKMDHGQILLQTPRPGLEIPNADTATPEEVTRLLAPVGAEMLARGLRERVFVQPVQDLAPVLGEAEARELRAAPKVGAEDRRVRWGEWGAQEILRRQRVLGELWSEAVVGGEAVRVIFSEGLSEAEGVEGIEQGVMAVWPGKAGVCIGTADGKTLRADRLKMAGYGVKDAAAIATKLGLVQRADESGWLRSKGLR